MDSNLIKTKSIAQLVDDIEDGREALRRSLRAWDLTLFEGRAILDTVWGFVLAWADALRLRCLEWLALGFGLRLLPGSRAVCPAGVGVMHASGER
jgi:hypothetical protein